ncbi:MAG: 50S ribosomal protein L28 [Thermomicrobiales bacterium]|nr:50S ribosomal protein L28 [Thermomicrobiales bacterium]
MSKKCAITGRKTTFGRNVSFSKRRTSRTYKPNVQSHRIWVPELNRYVRMDVSAKGLRTITKKGGLRAALKAKGMQLPEPK